MRQGRSGLDQLSRSNAARAAVAVVILVVIVGLALYARGSGAPAADGVAPAATSPTASIAASPSATGASAASPSNAPAAPSATAGPPHSDWVTYHGDPARRGFSGDQGSFTAVERAWQSGPLSGDAYAEPIVVNDILLVATEQNVVYGLNVRTGQQLWRVQLGPAVVASTLPCGDIGPVSGITGTPVGDPAAGAVYLVAFLQPAHHELYALDVRSGATRWHRTVDAPNADPKTHQQRGALALANGRVYVPYGGLLGDCGSYHGAVVGAPATGSGDLVSYQVPTPREAGIWATSGVTVDARGEIFVATGNGASQTTYDYSDAVIRLSPDLKVEDYWAPTDWLSLSRTDTDIGSVGPTLVDNGFVVEGGKNGYLYVLRAAALGGIGGEVARVGVGGGVFGGFAYANAVAYVPCTNGIAAVRIGADGTPAVLWHGPRFNAGSPIVAGGAVWAVDVSSGTLYALDAASGAVRTRQSVGGVQHFTTPTAYGDLILIAGGGRVVALQMR
ncbi:MAG: PQQ-binding-like beta-propeller repeat protein [Chloroflexota bacterium]|nr:PQQ-binding-like beta-propeller repeat protein [Chloroflexota bacterium]